MSVMVAEPSTLLPGHPCNAGNSPRPGGTGESALSNTIHVHDNPSRVDSSATNKHVNKSGPGRKPRACGECKRLKLKCEAIPGSRRCRHCQAKSLDCVKINAAPDRPFCADRYESKIDLMRAEIKELHSAMSRLAAREPSRATSLSAQNHETGSQFKESPSMLSTGPERRSTGMAMTRENSVDHSIQDSPMEGAVQVTEPMSSLYEVTRLRNIRSNQSRTARIAAEGVSEDFISRGVIHVSEAEELFRIFHDSLNHYLWVGLEQLHPSLDSVRQSSELLAATILTVTALHIPTSAETFDRCYGEFLALISSSMFSRYHSIDDVRALCIAAFWLSDVSWKLSGHAIRIATELNIHQSFYKALEGDTEHFLRARLWYMLYVCDHHSSIAYGRPPMIAESLQIREYELFLALPSATAIDTRLLSQVSLMQILTRVHEQFATGRLPHSDANGALLSEADFTNVRNYNLEIDNWRMKWFSRQRDNNYIGSFPSKGNVLYSYFAKLQLNSFAIRGVSISHGRLSTERKEFANMAISAAASVLTFVMEEEDMRRALVGTPLYVHTMIAFAAVFLMKVTTTWNNIIGLNVDRNYAWQLIERIIVLLKSCVASDRHLVYHIAAGLEKMLEKSRQAALQSQRDRAETSNSVPPADWRRQDLHQPSSDGLWDQTAFSNSDDDFYSTFPDMPIMNDTLIYEAFGSESVNDVYNLLTSQFSH